MRSTPEQIRIPLTFGRNYHDVELFCERGRSGPLNLTQVSDLECCTGQETSDIQR
jgi:hypothetical protein